MKYNTHKLRNLGLASLRQGTGLRETAKVTSMDFGVVTENHSTMVKDHNKVKRAQTEVIGMVTEFKSDELMKNGL